MNGQVERMIGILVTKMRSLLETMNVSRSYWPLAIVTAAYILNRTSSEALGGTTPLEAGTGNRPNLRNRKVFGCKAYVQIPKPQRRGKLSPTAWDGMMVGYATNSPEWIILDFRTNNLRKAHSVKFLEEVRGINTECSEEKPIHKHGNDGLEVSEVSEFISHEADNQGRGHDDNDDKSESSEGAGEDPPPNNPDLDERDDSSWKEDGNYEAKD